MNNISVSKGHKYTRIERHILYNNMYKISHELLVTLVVTRGHWLYISLLLVTVTASYLLVTRLLPDHVNEGSLQSAW